RAECVGALTRRLERAEENTPGLNGAVISSLVTLKAVESAPAIERAYAAGRVDESIPGTLEYVRYDLGLGPRPRSHRYPILAPLAGVGGGSTPRGRGKERAKARRKQAKKDRKKNRKKK